MQEYYLIPIDRDWNWKIDNQLLFDILKKNCPEIIELENTRVNILYETSPVQPMSNYQKLRYENHLNFMKRRYAQLNVPRYIIGCLNGFSITELITGAVIVPESYQALTLRRVTKEKALEYYYSVGYVSKISQLLPEYVCEKESTTDITLEPQEVKVKKMIDIGDSNPKF